MCSLIAEVWRAADGIALAGGAALTGGAAVALAGGAALSLVGGAVGADGSTGTSAAMGALARREPGSGARRIQSTAL